MELGDRRVTALVAGVLVIWSVFFFDKLKIDDPVGAISVHGANGLWGVIAVGLFSDGTYGAGWNGVGALYFNPPENSRPIRCRVPLVTQ